MNLLADVVNYIRRIVKTNSNTQLTDNLCIDYINRFYTYDVPARLQLFDLKTTWQFVTKPYLDRYNLPFDADGILQFQMLMNPAYCAGVNLAMLTQRQTFFNAYPNFQTFDSTFAEGDGSTSSFTDTVTNSPVIRAILDIIGEVNVQNLTTVPFTSLQPGLWITALDTNNNQMTIVDSPYSAAVLNGTSVPGTTDGETGYLVYYVQPSGQIPPINSTYTDAGTINYVSGDITVNFPSAVADGTYVQVAYVPFEPGTPRILLFYNNTLTCRPVPDTAYPMEIDAYLTPATFLSSGEALPFGYMSEYIARGAARKILSDVGDEDQFNFYEKFFREQEMLVLRRNDRQKSVERTSTIFTDINQQQPWNFTSGQGV